MTQRYVWKATGTVHSVLRIRMVLGLPDLDTLAPGTDPDPSIKKQKSQKNLVSYCFVNSVWLLILDK